MGGKIKKAFRSVEKSIKSAGRSFDKQITRPLGDAVEDLGKKITQGLKPDIPEVENPAKAVTSTEETAESFERATSGSSRRKSNRSSLRIDLNSGTSTGANRANGLNIPRG